MAHLTITPTTVRAAEFAITTSGLAGASVLAGHSLFYDPGFQVWKPSVSYQGLLEGSCHGVALNTALQGQPVNVITHGDVSFGAGSGIVPGRYYATSDAPGAIGDVLSMRTTEHRGLVGCGHAGDILRLGRFNSGIMPGAVLESHRVIFLFAKDATDNTPIVSPIIDTSGVNGTYNAKTIYFATGTIADADATFTPLVEDANVANFSDGAAVADAFLVSQSPPTAPETAAIWGAADDGEVRKIGYMGMKQYLRVTVTPALNTASAHVCGYLVLESGDLFPVPADGV